MTVTEIQERRGVMVIYADGSPCLKVLKKHFAKNPVAPGDELNLESYENTLASTQFADAYEAALTSLDFAARTGAEIERSLRLKGYVAPAAAAVIQRLTENHLIDDRHLAGRIAESSAKKPVGRYALKRKLRAKGISEEDAAEALEVLDDDQQRTAARQAAEKLARRYEGLPAREGRAKLSQALARRGFAWEAVRDAVDSVFSEDDDFE